jgi:hypothetical protein
MLENLLSDKMFQFTYFLLGAEEVKFKANISLVLSSATGIAFLLWILQIAKDIYDGALGSSNWKGKVFYSFLKVGIVLSIINTDVYVFLMRDIIGGIPQGIAERFSDKFMAEFWMKEADYFATHSAGKGKVGSFINIAFGEGAMQQLIASCGYFFMNAIALALPMVQRCVFELCCYFGPFAFVFLLCDWTKGVFDKWLSMSLAMAWLSVLTAMVMYVYVNSTMGKAIDGAIGDDVFTVAVTTIVSCVILLSAPMIATYLFNAGGSGVEKAGGWGAITGAAVAGGKAALPATGAAVGKMKSAGYNEDGSKKAGAGAAIARVAHSAGSMVVRGSAKPQSVSGELAKSLAEGKKSAGGGVSDGNSKLGGGSSVPSASVGGKSSGGSSSGSGTASASSVAGGGSSKGSSSVPSGGSSGGSSVQKSGKENGGSSAKSSTKSENSSSKTNPFVQSNQKKEAVSSFVSGDMLKNPPQTSSVATESGKSSIPTNTGKSGEQNNKPSIPSNNEKKGENG